MKKILILLAAAMLVVACGGNDKKDSVEQKAAKYMKEYLEADAAGDDDKVDQIREEIQKWNETLSESERERAEKAFEEAEKAFEEAQKEWKEAQKEAAAAKKGDVEKQAAEFATKLCDAEMDGDYSKFQKLQEEMMEWISGLSEEESIKAEAAFMKAVEKWQEEHAAEFDEEEWG